MANSPLHLLTTYLFNIKTGLNKEFEFPCDLYFPPVIEPSTESSSHSVIRLEHGSGGAATPQRTEKAGLFSPFSHRSFCLACERVPALLSALRLFASLLGLWRSRFWFSLSRAQLMPPPLHSPSLEVLVLPLLS